MFGGKYAICNVYVDCVPLLWKSNQRKWDRLKGTGQKNTKLSEHKPQPSVGFENKQKC